jgi:hypothetical protein
VDEDPGVIIKIINNLLVKTKDKYKISIFENYREDINDLVTGISGKINMVKFFFLIILK